jgi:hypothetical protein
MPFVILLTQFWLLNCLLFFLYAALAYCSGPFLYVFVSLQCACIDHSVHLPLHNNLRIAEWLVMKSDSVGSHAVFVSGVIR